VLSERQIENRIVKYAKDQGWLVIKLNPTWHKGLPDRMFLLPGGKIVFLELKKPGGRASPLQKYFIAWMKDLGHSAHVVDNYDEAVRILDASRIPATGDKDDARARGGGTVSRSGTWEDLDLPRGVESP